MCSHPFSAWVPPTVFAFYGDAPTSFTITVSTRLSACASYVITPNRSRGAGTDDSPIVGHDCRTQLATTARPLCRMGRGHRDADVKLSRDTDDHCRCAPPAPCFDACSPLSWTQYVVLSVLLTSVLFTTTTLLVKLWVFPVPLVMIITVLPSAIVMYASIGILVGREKLTSNPVLKTQLKLFANLVNFASFFFTISPVYSIIFRSLGDTARLVIVVLPPILTALLKMIAASVLADIEEIVPVVVITVDLFNALFQAKCMQTSGSVWTTVGIIGIDVIQNVYSLRKLFRYMLDSEFGALGEWINRPARFLQ